MSKFIKATRKTARARVALVGPSGSGKTFTSLQIARGLGGKIAVIDTERGSASKYAGDPDMPAFDVCELATFAPLTYVETIRDAAAAGYEVLVIDSLSHAWSGKEGALEQVDKAAKRSKSNNSFMAWRDVTPMHNELVDALLQAPMHVIVTMRAKTEYVLEDGPGGKKTPRKVGMAPIQRDGMEYEFDVVGDMDADNTLVISKTRCRELAEAIIKKPGADFGKRLAAWLEQGEAPAETPAAPPPAAAPPKPAPTARVLMSGVVTANEAKTRMEGDRVAKRWWVVAVKGPSGIVDLTTFSSTKAELATLGARVEVEYVTKTARTADGERSFHNIEELRVVDEPVPAEPQPTVAESDDADVPNF